MIRKDNPSDIGEAEALSLVVIEDEEEHFRLMKRVINKDLPHATLHHFRDCSECLEQIDRIQPDLIVTDDRMPGMNGIQFLEFLNERRHNIPVIMITGREDEKIAAQAMKLGAWDYLVKSADCFALLPRLLEKVVREKRLRESLKETERRFRDLAERTSDWIWEVDTHGRYTYSNPLVEAILGFTAEEVLGKHFYDFSAPQERESQKKEALPLGDQGRPISGYVKRLVHKDGHEIMVETSAVPIRDPSGALVGYRGIDRDITLRKRAEEHIRYLTRQLMSAQEMERQRLSADLHDVIMQDLSTLKIGLDTLLDGTEEAHPSLRNRVAELSKMLQESIEALRGLAYHLRPPTLDQLGLVRTIHRTCEGFARRNGIEVDFVAGGIDDLHLGSETEITLFRLIQEGLSNVKKHSKATRVAIRLVASYPKIILRIEDNGTGFDVESRLWSSLNERCMGIRSMEERVALLRGRMKIDSRPNHGTRIRIEFPLQEKGVG
ncbi:MAG TPA: PAS domain S-box protein [Syntrophobacteraceae bacterium]|nr:PAS domain S-box protein [Syntrophobacteraceae bacterium]